MADATTVYRAHPTQAEIDEVLGQRRSAALGTLNEVNHRLRAKYVRPGHAETQKELDGSYDDAWLPDQDGPVPARSPTPIDPPM